MKDKKKRRLSVKAALVIILLLISFFTLFSILLAQNVFLDSIYLEQKQGELIVIRDQLLSAETVDEKKETASALGREHITCVALYRYEKEREDHRITLLYNYEATAGCNCMIHRLMILSDRQHFENRLVAQRITETVEKMLLENRTWQVGRADTAEEESIAGSGLNAVGLERESESSYLIYLINTDTVPMSATVKTTTTLFRYVAGIILMCNVFFALILALWIAKPIEDLNRSAKKLALCDGNARFNASGYKEVEELSETLNYASEELSKVDHLQKELIANISHDLRTPITLIAGYAEMMRDLPCENNEENLQVIIDESYRMKALIQDVLDISKLRDGVLPLVREELNLTQEIAREMTRYNQLRDREGFVIDFLYEKEARVMGDRTRLMQVVYNLVNNAVNYCGEDKHVIVKQEVFDTRVRISVSDTGEGIPAEQLPLIWDRYYKVDKTHKRASVGTGLGLSIVKQTVALHNGSCGVTSTLGEGSTFWFELEMLS
ncbi:MAG: HAMP domain-containing histidine kinase [Clostridia bacterium]|nr:HAMP domain-containing histidine kinase [Clostridia bacterium]